MCFSLLRWSLLRVQRNGRSSLILRPRASPRAIWTASEQADGEGVQELRDNGIKTREPDVAVLIELEALGRELLFQWSEGAGEGGAQVVEAYYAIR